MKIKIIKHISKLVLQSLVVFAMFTGLFIPGHISAQGIFTSYALLIGGAGWSEEYGTKYQNYLFDTRKALIDKFGFPEKNVIVLAETRPTDVDYIVATSEAENIKAQFDELAKKVTTKDYVYIILFGHGSFDGKEAKFNLPGRDLTDTEYAELVKQLKAGRIIFINTSQSSFPFIEKLSAPNRIIITATKSGTERIETCFPEFLVEALVNTASDLDKNGDVSLLEIFTYASDKTNLWYEQSNHLATEHPQLEDTGDKNSFRASELEKNDEGHLAAMTFLKRRTAAITSSAVLDSTVIRLLQEQETVEQDIAELKSQKAKLREDVYYSRLEALLIHLAKITQELEKIKKDF